MILLLSYVLQAPKKEKGPAPRPPSIVTSPSSPEREKGPAPPPPTNNQTPITIPTSENVDPIVTKPSTPTSTDTQTAVVGTAPVSNQVNPPESVKNPAPQPPKITNVPPLPNNEKKIPDVKPPTKQNETKNRRHSHVDTQESSKLLVDQVCAEAEILATEKRKSKIDSNHVSSKTINDKLVKYSSAENINIDKKEAIDKKMDHRKSSADVMISSRNNSNNSSGSSGSSSRGLTRVNSQVVVEIRDERTGRIIPIRNNGKPPAPKVATSKVNQDMSKVRFFFLKV